ncbi:MAG: 3-hydroxyacyl-CoA dehydrogenase NAD-binding domain-containing protein [Cytophagaceae bacterium]|nr:3-hydroxyacyl-CoA dehydrogenase NAD-binding domain-containing protein [Cytophagaceae bacterium]
MKRIVVLGAGTMGNGIAHSFAQHGFSVCLFDTSPAALEKAMSTISSNADRQVKKSILSEAEKAELLARIQTETSLETSVQEAGLVIEAAPELETIKFPLFKRLDELCQPEVILASNTSSISITKLGAQCKHPERVVGMHFMNPVPVMKLVEIIAGYTTSEQVITRIQALSIQLQKVPVKVNDYPGFVSNRILMPMINEAIYTLFEGVAGVEEIDEVMKLGMSHPMGPLQLADFIGLDTCLSILNVLYDGFKRPHYAPCPLLVNMVAAGHLGKKSGKGFYTYER